MSELNQEDGRLFTVLMFVAGLDRRRCLPSRVFLALMPVIHRRSRSYRVGTFARSASGFARGNPRSPTINLDSTSPGELLEQHLLAINGMGSAISTLRTAAPNARDYQTERLDAFALAMNDHRDWLARLESVMDELEQLAENLIRISAETRSLRPKFSRPRAVAQSLSAGS